MSRTQSLTTEAERWDHIVQLTGGAANVCRSCGDCTVFCRWGLFRAGGPDMLAMLKNAELGAEADPAAEADLWACATCGCCEEICPRGVRTTDLIVGLRSLAYEEGREPPAHPEILANLRRDGNPDGLPRSLKRKWARDLGAPAIGSHQGCLVYFGSATAFDPRLQRIARAFRSVLIATEVDFQVFEDEPDSGAIARVLGAHRYLEQLINANIDTLLSSGIREIVATSPYDYDVFRRIYPRYGDAFRVFHVAEYLDQLIQYGRLSFQLRLEEPRRALYHDPCYLGRYHDLYDAPRRVLGAMPGLELMEFDESRHDAPCCGGGGARLWLEDAPGEGFADDRVLEAQDKGADLIVTSCPYCIQMFEDSIARLEVPSLEVRDVAELAAAWWPYAPVEEDLTFGTHSIA